jgi:hypothetical protein
VFVAVHMLHIVIWLYSIFPHAHNLKKKVIEHSMRVLIFCPTFVWNVSHSKKNLVRYDQKYIVIFMWSTHYYCHILMKLERLDIFLTNTQILNFMKIHALWTALFHEDGWTDMIKLVVTLWNFVNAPKNLFMQFSFLN